MKQKIVNFIMVMALICMPMIFTSCEEEEIEQDVVYQMGFTKVESSNLEEMVFIENTFKETIRVPSNTDQLFTVHGIISQLDKELLEFCKQAEEKLSTKVFQGKYIYTITNINTSKIIYEYKVNVE